MYSLGFHRNDKEELCVQGIPISDLVHKHGTPLFIYDSTLMEERYNAFLETVSIVKGNIHYAVKANDALAIISYFSKLGSGADIVSIGELHKCIAAGIASLLPVFKGNIKLNPIKDEGNKYSLTMLVLGLGSIVCVPVFKIITHLPPYVGMMLALGVVSIFAEIYSNREFELAKATGPNPDGSEKESKHHQSPVHNALTKIELPSILFFLGILLAVAALESLGLLFVFATILKESISLDLLMVLFGFASAVIDNVPLVAASLGMFTEFAPDDQLWHFLAYCAGTGGSMLIIGSAAGVVAMGMEKITFGWYLKKILWIALVGYFAGIGVFLLMRNFIG